MSERYEIYYMGNNQVVLPTAAGVISVILLPGRMHTIDNQVYTNMQTKSFPQQSGTFF